MNNTAKTTMSLQAKEIAILRESMERRSTGNDFQILKNWLKAMEVVTGALSLPHTGSAPLFLGLSIANIGIRSADSSGTGFIGPSFSKLIDKLLDGFFTSMMPEADRAKREFLTMVTTATYTFMITLAIQTSTQGVGKFSKEMETVDLKQTQFFAFELVVKLINSAAVPFEWFKLVIEACGGNKKAQEIGAPILAQIGNLLMIIAGSLEGKKPPYELISEEAKYLNKGIKAAIAAVTTQESGGHSEHAIVASLAVQQLLLALERHDTENFMEALSGFLESLGTSQNALTADIQRLRLIPNLITYLSEHAHDEELLTGIVNMA